MAETQLFIKNMVCDRCKMAVDKVLRDEGLQPLEVELGKARVEGEVSADQLVRIKDRLQALGFELLDDRKHQTLEQIKAAVIRLVHYKDNNSHLTLSAYLQQELHQDYSTLSKLFSEFSSITLERYFIEQRIERVKELITYDELTLTEIANKLNYSSVAYLSTQFRSVTGMTPSAFKTLQQHSRKGLDEI
jgi:AraC-like DNA-binding protein